ncbi:MAG: mevalonate kinase [Chloroflexi bacterium]|nr:mevalonate kinase [Chloroflexota bacterium]
MSSFAPLGSGHAPGKIIFFGEHAVVYGRPAIAVPLPQMLARAIVYRDQHCLIEATDLNRTINVAAADHDDPFACSARLVCSELGEPLPPWRIVVHSDIPIASGLGSGAAITAAIIRAMLHAFGATLSLMRLSELVYEVEKLHHGTPSGIDNTVVVYGQPLWFVRGQPPEPFNVGAPLHLLIADTGVSSPTRVTVATVRKGWQADRTAYETVFSSIGELVHSARREIETGNTLALGRLMDENQKALAELDVSSSELERLVTAARSSGALGAKLSGGGRGGNMIALVEHPDRASVAKALTKAGAKAVLATTLHAKD